MGCIIKFLSLISYDLSLYLLELVFCLSNSYTGIYCFPIYLFLQISECCFLFFLSLSLSLYITLLGQTASIRYGTGSIYGFFSEEQVTIGGLVVNDQLFLSSSS